jgi:hypothetical protein
MAAENLLGGCRILDGVLAPKLPEGFSAPVGIGFVPNRRVAID